MIPDIFRKIEVSPRVSFWISVFALTIVLFNNHIYISAIQEREKEANYMMQKNIQEANALATKSRLLKAWESQLIDRESEVKHLIQSINQGKNGR